jgi:hypothetical protein
MSDIKIEVREDGETYVVTDDVGYKYLNTRVTELESSGEESINKAWAEFSDKIYNWLSNLQVNIVGNKVVDELPEVGDAGILYLVPNEDNTAYTSYIYANDQWVKLAVIDFSKYVQKVQTINGKELSGNITLTATDIGGSSTYAKGTNSHAEGSSTIASGECSHAEGGGVIAWLEEDGTTTTIRTTATGNYSHAECEATTASGEASHSEGEMTTASGKGSHSEGYRTVASGADSHAEGHGTTASGADSHAEGLGTTASGADSHAEGLGTTASSRWQHVQGTYNVEDTEKKYADIVGCGNRANHSNASALDWDGNLYLKGSVYVNCNDDSTGGVNISTAVTDILKTVYPVGSVYMTSQKSFNPNDSFGGTWKQIEYDAYLKIVTENGGQTGGSTTHTIASDNLPAHTHPMEHNHKLDSSGKYVIASQTAYNWETFTGQLDGLGWKFPIVKTKCATTNIVNTQKYTGNTGKNTSASSPTTYYPGYYGVYVWERTE